MRPYTQKQKLVLEYVARYQCERGVSPTLEEIGEELGVTRVTAFQHVQGLAKRGAVRTTPTLSRSIEILDPDYRPGKDTIPVAGTIAAGTGIEALEDREDVSIGDLLPTEDGSYLLRVTGSSMIEDHIQDGDLVLVSPQPTARNGETVVAVLPNGDATLKRFYREEGGYRLEPANAAMSPIHTKDLTIRGVVRGVIRRM